MRAARSTDSTSGASTDQSMGFHWYPTSVRRTTSPFALVSLVSVATHWANSRAHSSAGSLAYS